MGEDEREEATSLLASVEHVAWTVGPLLAGCCSPPPEPTIAYWVNAVTFLLSAWFVSRIPAHALRSDDPITKGHWSDVKAGLGLVVSSRHLVTVLVVWTTAAIGTACVNVAEVVFAKDSLDAGNVGLGFLVSATGAGLLIGSFFAASVLGALGMTRVYAGALALMALGFGVASASPTIVVAALLAAIADGGQRRRDRLQPGARAAGAPDAMRGRALAVLMSIYYAVLGLSMAGGGLLVDAAGARRVGVRGVRLRRGGRRRARSHAWDPRGRR